MRWFYEIMYRHFRAPWEIGPREELVGLVEDGALTPCRAVDLGCGTGANAIFLAQHGFEVTGVDFATAGIEKASRAAADAGLSVNFVVDDMTDLQRTRGPFDFLLKGERPTTSSSREVAAARTLKLIDTVACPVPTPFLSPSEKRVAREASRSRDRAIANAMRAGWAADNADAFNWPYEAASVYPEP